MKKNSILKALGIVFLAYVVLSWIIPGGTFSGVEFTKDTTYPLGLGDIIAYPLSTMFSSSFAGEPFFIIGLIILAIGGLYGVMNKTGVYANVVDKIAKKFEKKKTLFLIISILVFAVLASLTTLTLPLFILVPFMMTIILLLGYDKIVALLSTVGAILVGNMAVMYGYNKESLNYFNALFGIEVNELIVLKIVLFIVSTLVLVLFILYYTKKQAKPAKKGKKSTKGESKEETILLYSKEVKTKKSALPAIIISAILVILSLVGMYSWEGAFGIELFNNIHNAITSFNINNYAIFADVLGTSNGVLAWTIGRWSNNDLLILLVIASILIGLVYKLSLKDIVDGFVDGMRQVLKVAVIAVLANVIYVAVIMTVNYGGSLFITSIINRIIGAVNGMNYFAIAGITAITAPLFNELPYLIAVLRDPIETAFTNHALLSVIMQTVYGFMMFILPTSVILVAGMSYADVSVKEYFKSSWKLLLALLIAITAVILLFMYCPGIAVM